MLNSIWWHNLSSVNKNNYRNHTQMYTFLGYFRLPLRLFHIPKDGNQIKKYLKSKIYGKLTTIKLIILSFRLYLCSYLVYFFVWYCLFDEFCYVNTDFRLFKLFIIVKFTIKIHMALEKYIKITVFLLNMKYLHNIWMLDKDFLAGSMLIRPNLLGVYLRKCLIFLWLGMVWLVFF